MSNEKIMFVSNSVDSCRSLWRLKRHMDSADSGVLFRVTLIKLNYTHFVINLCTW